MRTVDARGCACPEPVMMTRDAIRENASGAEILVDNTCAVENITRFANNFGYSVVAETNGTETKLILTKK